MLHHTAISAHIYWRTNSPRNYRLVCKFVVNISYNSKKYLAVNQDQLIFRFVISETANSPIDRVIGVGWGVSPHASSSSLLTATKILVKMSPGNHMCSSIRHPVHWFCDDKSQSDAVWKSEILLSSVCQWNNNRSVHWVNTRHSRGLQGS